MIKFTSLNCPDCGENTNILITEDEYSSIINGELIQHALSRFPANIRERFITGYCDKCWDKMFEIKK